VFFLFFFGFLLAATRHSVSAREYPHAKYMPTKKAIDLQPFIKSSAQFLLEQTLSSAQLLRSAQSIEDERLHRYRPRSGSFHHSASSIGNRPW